MKNVIHGIIHCDQIAYVKGWYIGESVRLIDDLLRYADLGKLDQFVKGKGFLEVGTRSQAALTTFRFNTRLIVMMWQPE